MNENIILPIIIRICFQTIGNVSPTLWLTPTKFASRFGNARLFSRWFESLRGGKHVVVVVVSDPVPTVRHWVITAYIVRKLAKGGDIEWERT